MAARQTRWLVPLVVVILIGIQAIPVSRTNPPVRSEITVPDSVSPILRRSCYDCHSNETRWPWYSRVAPSSWFVSRHVEKGRSELNFSEWPHFDFEEQERAMHEIQEEIEDQEMPLKSYLLLHPDARLSDADRKVLLRWAGEYLGESDGSEEHEDH